MDYAKNNSEYEVYEPGGTIYVNPMMEILWTHAGQEEPKKLVPEPQAEGNSVRYVYRDLLIPPHPYPDSDDPYTHTFELLADGVTTGKVVSVRVHSRNTELRYRGVIGFATDTPEVPCIGGEINIVLNFEAEDINVPGDPDAWIELLAFDINRPINHQAGFAPAGLTDERVLRADNVMFETVPGDWQKGIDISLPQIPVELRPNDLVLYGYSRPEGETFQQMNVGININGNGFRIIEPELTPMWTENYYGQGVHQVSARLTRRDLEGNLEDGAATVGIRFYPLPYENSARFNIHSIRIVRPPQSWINENPNSHPVLRPGGSPTAATAGGESVYGS